MERPFIEKISLLWKKKSFVPILILSICGLCLLLFSNAQEETVQEEPLRDSFDEAVYVADLEERTQSLLSKVEGVGRVQVMLTMEEGFREHYLSDTQKSESSNAEKSESQESSGVILQTEKNGVRTPIVCAVTMPKVRGVSVVCTGGADPTVQLKVIHLLEALFDLNSARISVTN